jgi:hypothetical protein
VHLANGFTENFDPEATDELIKTKFLPNRTESQVLAKLARSPSLPDMFGESMERGNHASPTEVMEQSYGDIRESLAVTILNLLSHVSPGKSSTSSSTSCPPWGTKVRVRMAPGTLALLAMKVWTE